MGYSDNPGMVRVDRFKSSGKWYDTFAVDMSDYYNLSTVHDAVRYSLILHAGSDEFVTKWLDQGGFFVCLEPYHRNSYPIVLKKFIKES